MAKDITNAVLKRLSMLYRKTASALASLCLLFFIGFIGLAKGQVQVIQTIPPPYSLLATPAQTIEIEFSQAIDPATLQWPNIRIRGTSGGDYVFSGFVNGNGIKLNTLRPFFNGEQVIVTLTPHIRSNSGNSVQPYSFRFTVRNEYGTAIFSDNTVYPLPKGKDPVSLHIADLNQDFLPDIISTNYSSQSIAIFRNDYGLRDTKFSAVDSISVGNGPTTVATGDVNGDRLTDIAVANFLDKTVTLLLKKDTGANFEYLNQSIQVGERPLRVKFVDVDYDGDLDLLVLSFGRDALEIYKNDGNGNFTLDQRINQFPAPTDFALGDWNQDGLTDFVVSSSSTHKVYALVNDGTGNFHLLKEIDAGIPISQIIVQDVLGSTENQIGNGLPDLIALSQAQNQVNIFSSSSGTLWADTLQVFANFSRPFSAAVADFDTSPSIADTAKDYDLDMVVTSFDNSQVQIFLNDRGQAFSPASPASLPAIAPTAIATGDFDRDGDQDIVVAETQNQQLRIFWNWGSRPGSVSIPFEVLNFDTVRVTQSKTLNLTATNISDLPANIRFNLQVQNVFSIPFSDTTVSPGARVTLPVTFAPHDTLDYESLMTINIQDAFKTNSKTVLLKGKGIRPIYLATPDTLYFGAVPPGHFKNASELIQNIGNVRGKLQNPQIMPGTYFTLLNDSTLYLPAKSHVSRDFRFHPDTLGLFFANVALQTDDPLQPTLSFVLKGLSSSQSPSITSADTLFATEDIFVTYEATAIDPEGDSVAIWFEGLPNWLKVSANNPNQVQGTPKEGDRDTRFWVIASDGFLLDSLRVQVRVTPVNDPPKLQIIPHRQIYHTEEMQTIQFDLRASDPEDSTILIASANMPSGATLAKTGRNQAHFNWTPGFGQAGNYSMTFTATEAYENPPLQDNLAVQIFVGEILPDLQALEILTGETTIFLQHSVQFTMRWTNSFAPIRESFKVRLQDNGVTQKDTSLTSMAIDEELTWTVSVAFADPGSHQIELVLDPDNVIAEQNENNNLAQINLEVIEGQLYVSPNPFTPNNDGFNDRVQFDAREFILNNPSVKIWDFQGKLVRILNEPQQSIFIWNGLDENGNELRPGIYLYVFYNGNKALRSGHVVLAR